MAKRIIALSLLLACFSAVTSLTAQEQTMGLFINEPGAFNGYTLFAPLRDRTTYLIDNSGRLVHSWDSDFRPGLVVYLRENGNLLHTCQVLNNPTFQSPSGGGHGGIVQEFTWDGTPVWEFEYSNSQHQLHHDIEQLPNGNMLMIAWEYKSYAECIAAGRDTLKLRDFELWPDHVIEVEPGDSVGGTIVWEWHVWDHLIQDYDATKDNYGVVEDHPELVDLNFTADINADWLHTNAIDYHVEFDQIALSIYGFSEIWVIDHSTTTAEAAGHTGGNSGKGGDLLYRWGNPQAYRAGTPEDRQFYFQHDVQWIESGYPGEGNIMVFNNGWHRPGPDYSSIEEIVPPVDSLGNYFLAPGSAYGPEEPIWIYIAENPPDFSSSHLSGTNRLPNGNTLICNGNNGIFFEVTPDTETVWLYVNPVTDQGPLTQGDSIPVVGGARLNSVFRAYRYAPDYPGFQGHPLVPGDPIELYPDNIDDVRINYNNSMVTLCWSHILNPLVLYYVYTSDDPWNNFSLVSIINDSTWSTFSRLDRRFYQVTFEVAP